MKVLLIFGVLVLISISTNAKTFTKCELAKKLDSSGISRASLPDWICLVQYESGFKSHIKGRQNRNKSYDWGLFQINDKYWCKVGRAGGDCNIDCNKLLTDNIDDDITCAKKIFKRHNFNAWYGWKNNCKGKTLPSVSECF